ncbi:MAG TPA: hypothetical protein O0X31_04210, partial [Methanocorpusculum sp.]|nr:hypothetical protein [Methanocorpusculum sp.]
PLTHTKPKSAIREHKVLFSIFSPARMPATPRGRAAFQALALSVDAMLFSHSLKTKNPPLFLS